MKKKISLRVIQRVSFYYEALLKSNLPDDSFISSMRLEEVTGVSSNQVRQDFFYLGISIGKQKKGYQVKRLFNELKRVLLIDKEVDVIVIGAGRLGCALSEYRLFKVRNINIVALFDVKEELISKSEEKGSHCTPIYHIDELDDFLSEHRDIKIALLTVSENSAQVILDKLIKLGIRGIVNFAPKILKTPEHLKNVQIVNDCIGAPLYKIVYQIYNKA